MRTVNIRILHTSDIHGCLFPFDFLHGKEATGSLSRAYNYIKSRRKTFGRNLLLVDSGDILQGQPTFYLSNFINTEKPNLAASVYNYMQYDCVTIGNHDIETGHLVYDKFNKELDSPLLAANIICTETGKPYFKPYTIIEREGVRIAIIGMTTPTVPYWLNEELWQGMRFLSIEKCTREYVELVKDKENADIIIGLFHTGWKGGLALEEYEENAVRHIAESIEGIDAIFFGHDHRLFCDTIMDRNGHKVLCINPASDAHYIGEAEITVVLEDNTSANNHVIISKEIHGKLTSMEGIEPDERIISDFSHDYSTTKHYMDQSFGSTGKTTKTRDCFFGNAPLTDFIHHIQMEVCGADVSFSAPLCFDEVFPKGPFRMKDIFNLYKYENQIYALMMTGEEIVRYLETSYDLWIDTMLSAEDHIMKIQTYEYEGQEYTFFKNLAFNFDTAAGIIYTVDVTQTKGRRINILSMSDGTPFSLNAKYKVAMHSYRGNGGTEFLTRGAGIPHEELRNRTVFRSPHNMRYYIQKEFENHGDMYLKADNNWHFIPTGWTEEAIRRDRNVLFPEKMDKDCLTVLE